MELSYLHLSNLHNFLLACVHSPLPQRTFRKVVFVFLTALLPQRSSTLIPGSLLLWDDKGSKGDSLGSRSRGRKKDINKSVAKSLCKKMLYKVKYRILSKLMLWVVRRALHESIDIFLFLDMSFVVLLSVMWKENLAEISLQFYWETKLFYVVLL